eukprot:gnl/TRDRNA2_/TRDRNA2_173491_c3_seq3.p1 gnl/TRDRNA2_/TRDRNA2_173491_c3~~gnl/TRDRNA2_/TRDRNA2_173491_c3_seq3.p1  ORF type:complete len:239 (-),score=28.16 gnl/TRDRNA2_/TRDRNA2_173491_c3_seq3:61-777(-)
MASSSSKETAPSELPVDVDVCVKLARTGAPVFQLRLPVSTTIKEVKLKIWGKHGHHLFAQDLLLGSESLNNNQEIGQLGYRLEMQLNIRTLNREKGASLWDPASEGDVVRVEQILSDQAHPDYARTADGGTALIAAASRGHLAVVQCLCEAGAEKDKADLIYGATPLFVASRMGQQLEVVRYLCQAGADKDKMVQTTAVPLGVRCWNGALRFLWSDPSENRHCRTVNSQHRMVNLPEP